ncbi:MAG: hypothetical protein SFW66_08620 [Gammaproteobacteria bacterium]|nr:hypothetical protein [Gammaproteobacteria bacterium]
MRISIFRKRVRIQEHKFFGVSQSRDYDFQQESVLSVESAECTRSSDVPHDEEIKDFFWQNADRAQECNGIFRAGEIMFQRNQGVSCNPKLEEAYFKAIADLLFHAISCGNLAPITSFAENQASQPWLIKEDALTLMEPKPLVWQRMRLFKSSAVVSSVSDVSNTISMSMTWGA